MHETISFCPMCYAVIPAVIYEKDGGAWMTKVCQKHGSIETIVERSFDWWLYCKTHTPRGIYNGYVVDITSRCNLSCKHCFHRKTGKDRSVEAICYELKNRTGKCFRVNGQPEKTSEFEPIILFGGEPTIHNDFFKLISIVREKFGTISIVTNGTKTSDISFFNRVLPYFLTENGINTTLNISMHKESDGADIETLENARKNKVKIYSVLTLIDNIEEVDGCVKLFQEYSDVIENMRIRTAIDVWAEEENPNRIFVSDIINKLYELGTVKLMEKEKVTGFANLLFNEKLHIITASCPDITNVDLLETNCPPWYQAMDGGVYNLFVSFMINEGIEKGFYAGEKN